MAAADILRIFGANVRALREKKGVSQEALAELADLHRTYVGGIERGERNVSLLNIAYLARALDVPPAELMSGIGTKILRDLQVPHRATRRKTSKQ
jgi:transcriptional regulator with XRE-family HTH domain